MSTRSQDGQRSSAHHDEQTNDQDDTVTDMSDADVRVLLTGIPPGDAPQIIVRVLSSMTLLRGWAPQPSPCCAAASLAGALNGLKWGQTADTSKRWTHLDILPVYVAMTNARITRQQMRLRRFVTLEELDQIHVGIETILARKGLALGDTSKATRGKITKKVVVCAVREYLEADGEVSRRLQRMWSDTSSATGGDGPDVVVDEHDAQPIAGSDETQSPPSVAFDIPLGTCGGEPSQNFESEIYQYFHLVDGREKLLHPSRPSTAICGNSALLFAVEALNASVLPLTSTVSPATMLRASLFIGMASGVTRSPKICYPISRSDTEDYRMQMWEKLGEAFKSPQTALIYHLKNHYALIFAIRERCDADKILHRELLTARRGQRPRTWITWDEAYENMLAWSGYKIVRLSVVKVG